MWFYSSTEVQSVYSKTLADRALFFRFQFLNISVIILAAWVNELMGCFYRISNLEGFLGFIAYQPL